MKPVAFDYVRPASIAEAVEILSLHPDAKVMAGGQTLGPMLNLRLAQPTVLIDITRIPDLARVEETRDHIVLGACITHAAVEDGRVPDPGGRVLIRVAHGIAYRAVRTRGTIGGSIAHADPAADWLSLLVALDATVILHGPAGRRTQRLAEFVKGAMMTELAADELVTGLQLPRARPRVRFGYHKICRKTGEFAEAIGVAVHDAEQDTLRLVAGATGGAPIVIDDMPPPTATDGARKAFVAGLQSRLRSSGIDNVYELGVHAAALERAVDEAFTP